MGLPLIKAGHTIRVQAKRSQSGEHIGKSNFLPAFCYVCGIILLSIVIHSIYQQVASFSESNLSVFIINMALTAGAGILYFKAGRIISIQRRTAGFNRGELDYASIGSPKAIAKSAILVAVVIFALLFGLAAISLLSQYRPITAIDSVINDSAIKIGGTVTAPQKTNATNYVYLTEIVFIDKESGTVYRDALSGSSYAYYDLKLPFGSHEYAVQAKWRSYYANITGICDFGGFSTDESVASGTELSRDFSC